MSPSTLKKDSMSSRQRRQLDEIEPPLSMFEDEIEPPLSMFEHILIGLGTLGIGTLIYLYMKHEIKKEVKNDEKKPLCRKRQKISLKKQRSR